MTFEGFLAKVDAILLKFLQFASIPMTVEVFKEKFLQSVIIAGAVVLLIWLYFYVRLYVKYITCSRSMALMSYLILMKSCTVTTTPQCTQYRIETIGEPIIKELQTPFQKLCELCLQEKILISKRDTPKFDKKNLLEAMEAVGDQVDEVLEDYPNIDFISRLLIANMHSDVVKSRERFRECCVAIQDKEDEVISFFRQE